MNNCEITPNKTNVFLAIFTVNNLENNNTIK